LLLQVEVVLELVEMLNVWAVAVAVVIAQVQALAVEAHLQNQH
jgi:hypothetical protein